MMQSFKASIIAIGLAAVMGGAAYADTLNFTATLNAGSEVPPKLTPGSGTVTASLDTATNILTYTVNYANLTGPATAAHFHGPAASGSNGPVAVPLSGVSSSPITGTANLTAAQVADLTNGLWYANVHTDANPDGEIRGQLQQGN